MAIDREAILRFLEKIKAGGRRALLDVEGLELLEMMGLTVPNYTLVEGSTSLKEIDWSLFPGEKVVVKVVSPEILHKSDEGGVAIVAKDPAEVQGAIEVMEERFAEKAVTGYTLNAFIPYDPSLGSEILVGMRWTPDFGPVVTVGAGGIYTEFLAKTFRTGMDVALFSPAVSARPERERLEELAITPLLTGKLRNQRARLSLATLEETVATFLELADDLIPALFSEFEVNPFVIHDGRLVALDVLATFTDSVPEAAPSRPIGKIRNLLEPGTIAIIGVSEKMNPGHIIVNNLIREGFEREKIFIVKPGTETLEGCHCYPDIASLPQKVDLFILSVAAHQVPEIITEVVRNERAESLIVIPGGLEEKEGTQQIVASMRSALKESRRTPWGGPVINGGNCLGIRSRPGKVDTMFIPEYKLPVPQGETSPVAFISQSGAFAVSKTNKLAGVNPKYALSIGNQMDLTIGDYLTYLKDDDEIQIYAVYVEGFKILDGRKFLEAAAQITRSGRTVILYRAGRTAEGAKASASHTASLAGDYTVTREVARQAGILIAETLADFEDLTRLFTFLRKKEVGGLRLGAVSNAGFECVAIADNLGSLTLPSFSEETTRRLEEIFEKVRIDAIVDIHNPIDLTPMTYDEPYEAVIRAVLDDAAVDVGIVGCVPLTPALNTLPKGEGHRDDLERSDSIVNRMARIMAEHPKPWIAVVDGGAIYDPMARTLEARGIPTFRTADRALRLFNIFCRERVKGGT